MQTSSKINVDLQEERNKVQFNIEEFTNWFYGGKENVDSKRFLENYFMNDPELQDKFPTHYLSHKDLYEDSIRKSTVLLKKLRELESQGHSYQDLNSSILGGKYHANFIRQGNPLSVHYDMFIPALKSMGTPEQQAEWVSRAYNCEIIGAYAQTELGHGTFIRGLETTATYDPKTKEFVIHSPSITAYKWWPGGLGHTSNHALIFAQLYTQGKNHGIQPFVVQIRVSETHKPLPGIVVGEIGNKVGFNTVNNGYLGFENVRIPLKNMLMKNAKVLENGEFIKQKSSVLAYGTMTYIRVGILMGMADGLSKAATIAMRYSAVRRQSPIDPNQPEPKIIEHVTQQMKVFPVIAKTIVFNVVSNSLLKTYKHVMAEIEKGKLDGLPDLHALSCCLKAVTTNETTQAIETSRLACGGHGYLSSAGFYDLYRGCTAAQTYEGENTVLLLQTARFLMKAWAKALKGEKLTPTVAYLKDFVNVKAKVHFEGSWNGILRALQAAAAGTVASAFNHLEARKKVLSAEEATNQTGIELVKAAELHCQVFILQSAIETLTNATKTLSPALNVVLRDVLELYAVDLAFRMLGSLTQFNEVTSEAVEKLQDRLEANLKRFRINAIGLVDGFDISDSILRSTLGAYDGNVYERLLNEAKKSPLNQEDVNRSFDLYLKPLMKSNL